MTKWSRTLNFNQIKWKAISIFISATMNKKKRFWIFARRPLMLRHLPWFIKFINQGKCLSISGLRAKIQASPPQHSPCQKITLIPPGESTPPTQQFINSKGKYVHNRAIWIMCLYTIGLLITWCETYSHWMVW